MDIKQLQAFIAVVDHGGLGKAGARLHLSASTISGYLSQLEAELGAELFVRLPRGVKSTDAGQALYRNAHMVLQAIEQLRHNVSVAATEITGLVRVCLPTSPATILSLPLLDYLRQHHPRIRLELFEGFSGHLEEMLNQNRYDFGLLYRSATIKGLIVEPILDEDLVLIGGFDPIDRRDIPLTELRDLRFVFPSQRHALRRVIDRAFDAHGMQPEVIADLDTLQAIRHAVFNRRAASILSMSGIRSRAGEDYTVSVRRIINPTITRTVSLCYPENDGQMPAVAVAAGILVELTRQAVLYGSWPSARLRN